MLFVVDFFGIFTHFPIHIFNPYPQCKLHIFMHFPNASLRLGAKAFQSVFSFGVVETMGREPT
jgi:hypothetical protein